MTEVIAHLRDGTEVGAWLLKAHPSIWDIGTALGEGVELDWWRLAPSYRVELVHAGHPCAMWVTRGDAAGAVGRLGGRRGDRANRSRTSGDPDDPLWVDEGARRQVRPRIPVRLEVLEVPVRREELSVGPPAAPHRDPARAADRQPCGRHARRSGRPCSTWSRDRRPTAWT